MKIHEYNQMMKWLTRPKAKINETPKETWDRLAEVRKPSAVPPKTETIQKFKKGGKPENNKMLEYINDMKIVYDSKKVPKAEAEAAVKRQELREKKLEKYFNKKSPKKIAKIPVLPPKPDMANGHSNWTSDDWLETIDQGGWVDDRKVEANGLYDKYLELLKAGELLPGTSFEMFEKNY